MTTPEAVEAGESEDEPLLSPEELHIALVRPLGTDIQKVVAHLGSAFAAYGFHSRSIKLSAFLSQLYPAVSGEPGSYDYYMTRMDAGNWLRKEYGGETLAFFAIQNVTELRKQYLASPRKRIVYIYDSVMHPDEVNALRQTYGASLFVIALSKSERKRRARLFERVSATSEGQGDIDARAQVKELLDRDLGRNREGNRSLTYENTFYRADVFLDSSIENAGN